MKVSIHQPQFLPYPGFFHKLSLSHIFVIMDDTQYDKRFTNRNRIISSHGWNWITVPIIKEHKFFLNNRVKINNKISWKEEHWKKIFHTYANSKFFNLYKDYFEKLYEKDWELLFDLNFETIKNIVDWLGIKIEIIKESELNITSTSTQRLVDICKKVGADTYVSGYGGKNYMEENLFKENNLKLEYQNYTAFPYPQHQTKIFVPMLSIIDLLFNLGPKSLDHIKNNVILSQT